MEIIIIFCCRVFSIKSGCRRRRQVTDVWTVQ